MEPDKKSESPNSLIRMVSHQLKSPLASIESLLNMIVEGFTGETDSTTAHYIKKAAAKAAEARELVTDLTAYERYTANQEIKPEAVEMVNLLNVLADSYHTAAAEKSISITVSVPQALLVVIHAERAGLELALKNLLENSVKYTNDNGEISLCLSVDKETNTCRIEVRDNGVGISPEDLKHIFEPFYRAPSRKAEASGTGLGLSLVKSVVDRFKGSIDVRSQTGAGTTFSITLPCASVTHDNSAQPQKKRVVIIGGVTAGPKAAARLRRLDETLSITIVERSELLSYAGCGIPSYLSGKVRSPKALMSTSDNTLRDVHFFESIKNIKILNRTEAIEIDRAKKEVAVRNLDTKKTFRLPYDVLILATGAESVVPKIEGIQSANVFSLYRIEDAEAIKRRFADHPASDVFIIGGGLVGIETAESLLVSGARVTILEKDTHILKAFDPDIAAKVEMALSHKGIKVITGITIHAVQRIDEEQLIVTDKGEFRADVIILSAGVRPNATLGANAGLAIGSNGGITVNEFLETSDKNIYAIGDCTESVNLLTQRQTFLPLGSISTKMGRIAADNIAGKRTPFPGGIGTVMFKVFDIQVGRTGLEIGTATQEGFSVESVVVSGLDKAHYEPDARPLVLKVLADRVTRRVLGAQGYGKGDLVRQLAVLAAAISHKLTLDELFTLDLGYYPAFNNPIDIAQTAGLVLANKIDGLLRTITPEALPTLGEQINLIDLNPLQEHLFNTIHGSVNIPLENIRREAVPYPKDARIVLYSKTSSRAYEAYRYLNANGYTDLFVLEGGFLYWKSW